MSDDFVITGTMVHYAATCDTKLWLHLRGVQPERDDHYIRAGSINDKLVSKSIYMDGIMIDDLDLDNKRLIEYKVNSIGEGPIKQLVHYLQEFPDDWSGLIKSRKGSLQIEKQSLDDLYQKISILAEKAIAMPEVINMPMCNTCAFKDFCYA